MKLFTPSWYHCVQIGRIRHKTHTCCASKINCTINPQRLSRLLNVCYKTDPETRTPLCSGSSIMPPDKTHFSPPITLVVWLMHLPAHSNLRRSCRASAMALVSLWSPWLVDARRVSPLSGNAVSPLTIVRSLCVCLCLG